jgi:hypothetical protein
MHNYAIIIGRLLRKILLMAMAPRGTGLSELSLRQWNVHVQFTGLETEVTVDWIS